MNTYDQQPTGSHYSLAQSTAGLAFWAAGAARDLRKLLRPDELPVFAYRGMSGCAAATALSLAYLQAYGQSFGMIYVRKDSEKSHGSAIEADITRVQQGPTVLVFVDDFVANGTTRWKVMSKAREWLRRVDKARMNEEEFIQVTMKYEPSRHGHYVWDRDGGYHESMP
ncbi:hypothetical protein [Caulobacter phage DCM]|uniref:Phosphoribosyltransferase n=1 Tax=Caulobacter phage DCM TaxID=3020391 RepID=A0AAE9WX74_9CAUD|nr:hypothetical protein [Caulobacter phage DCM]WCD56092.1 hypothetical protein [Caulobacter phage BL199]